jgi:epoxyqueuosine reductase
MISSSLVEEAKASGFLAVGFSDARKPLFFDRFCGWLAAGKQGEMQWLVRQRELREHPGRLLEDCRTVITLAYPYASSVPCTLDGFTAARYTEPGSADYHQRLRKVASELVHHIEARYPGSRSRICVDSAPLLERSFAYTSGIGFIGRNNMLIIPGHGSYVFLVEILTTAEFPFSRPSMMESRCGTCKRCMEACPTGALEKPYGLDARKCLSYLTVEFKGQLDRETGKKMGTCFYGCDRCQAVCPFNAEETPMYRVLPSTDEFLSMSERDFNCRFRETAFGRAGLQKIKENIQVIRGS